MLPLYVSHNVETLVSLVIKMAKFRSLISRVVMIVAFSRQAKMASST
jgi:hypothetical protein